MKRVRVKSQGTKELPAKTAPPVAAAEAAEAAEAVEVVKAVAAYATDLSVIAHLLDLLE